MINLFLVCSLLISQGHFGSDSFGYYFLDSDTASGPGFLWVEPTDAETLHLADDDNALVSLPFPFPFYNSTLRQIYVVSNGYLTSTNTRAATNVSMPVTSMNNLIAPFWDDLNPATGGAILTFTTQDAFVIQWNNVPHYGSGGPYTFEVILYRNGNIAFSYLNLGVPRNSSTIGIQGGTGENGYYLPYVYNGSPFEPHDSLTVIFYRPADIHIIDVSPTLFVYPDSSIMQLGSNMVIGVEVLNGSTDTVTTTVQLMIKKFPDDSIVFSDTRTLTDFPPYSIDTVEFSNYVNLNAGFYEVKVYSTTPGDTNYDNDTIRWSYLVPDSLLDFEADGGNFMSDNGWEWGIATVGPSTAHSGVKLWGTVLNGNYANRADYQLIGRFIATGSFAAFGFFHWFETERRMDGGNVSISINSDSSWFVVYPEAGYSSYVFPLGDDGYTGSSGGWVDAVFRIDSVNAGDTVYIRMRFKSGRYNTAPGWYIDDFAYFSLIPIEPVGVAEEELGQEYLFSGNVVSGKLFLSVRAKGDESMEVYNCAGRRIMKVDLHPGLNEISISRLKSGIYFLKVSGKMRRIMVLN